MALGKREVKKGEVVWVTTWELPTSPGHPFYEKLNRLLAKAGFDRFVESLCAPYYAEKLGRPSIPPGVYFRMLLVGYFEGIDSQRGIAWRCSDSRCLGEFLGMGLTDKTPDHSSLTVIRQRLPMEVHEAVFTKVLSIAREHGLVKGKTIAVDATTLEANAAMKSIVRKETGEDWTQYLTGLAKEAGIEDPTAEDLKRFDKKRKDKKVSNKEWESKSDPDSRVMKMKDGRTHLGYKAEHAVDLETEVVLSATVHHGDRGDAQTGGESVVAAQVNLVRAGAETAVAEVVADCGYHDTEMLVQLEDWGIRSYIPEQKRKKRVWAGKPREWQEAVYANRRRLRGARGRRLQRLRSERVERSFAHVCDTGGARRSWIRGLIEVAKRYLLQVAAHNLGLVMRKVFGIGKPRCLQGSSAFDAALYWAYYVAFWLHYSLIRLFSPLFGRIAGLFGKVTLVTELRLLPPQRSEKRYISTGC
jgi:transposase